MGYWIGLAGRGLKRVIGGHGECNSEHQGLMIVGQGKNDGLELGFGGMFREIGSKPQNHHGHFVWSLH